MPKLIPSLAATALLGCLTACVVPPPPGQLAAGPQPGPVAEPVLASYPALPPPRVEVIPPPPRRRFAVWEPGHWHWDGVRYDWIGGHYVDRREAGRWVPGHWDARPGGYVWVRAHWA